MEARTVKVLVRALMSALLLSAAVAYGGAAAATDRGVELLEADLEDVRVPLGIPGMAAAVVQGGQLIWSAGFGFADVENGVAATPNTPFGLASVTKPMAATLVMQLVEEA